MDVILTEKTVFDKENAWSSFKCRKRKIIGEAGMFTDTIKFWLVALSGLFLFFVLFDECEASGGLPAQEYELLKTAAGYDFSSGVGSPCGKYFVDAGTVPKAVSFAVILQFQKTADGGASVIIHPEVIETTRIEIRINNGKNRPTAEVVKRKGFTEKIIIRLSDGELQASPCLPQPKNT